MPEYLAPGVYVEETSFRAKSIEGVGTSTTGFIGPTRFGPINGVPELLTSFNQFERIYGGLDPLMYGEQEVPNFMAHAVRAFFDNGGSRLYVARTYTKDDQEEGIATTLIPASAPINAETLALAKKASAETITALERAKEGLELVLNPNTKEAAREALRGAAAEVIRASPSAAEANPPNIDFEVDDVKEKLVEWKDNFVQDVAEKAAVETKLSDLDDVFTQAMLVRNAGLTNQETTAFDDLLQQLSGAVNNGESKGGAEENDIPSDLDVEAKYNVLKGQLDNLKGKSDVLNVDKLAFTVPNYPFNPGADPVDVVKKAYSLWSSAEDVINNADITTAVEEASEYAQYGFRAAERDAKARLSARFPGAAGDMLATVRSRLGANVFQWKADGNKEARQVRHGDLVVVVHNGRADLCHANKTGGQWLFEKSGNDIPIADLAKYSQVLPLNLSVEVTLPGKYAQPMQWENLTVSSDKGRLNDSFNGLFALDIANRMQALETPLVLRKVNDQTDLPPDYELAGYLIGRSAFDVNEEGDIAPKMTLQSFMLSHGGDGKRPESAEYEGKGDDNSKVKSGLKSFEDLEDISILAAPGATYVKGSDPALDVSISQINQHLLNHCAKMHYRVAVLDSQNNQSLGQVRNYRAFMDSKYGAVYYPWVRIIDPISNTELSVPPSGFMAGIYARTDVEVGVHKAPANAVVRGAIGLEVMLNKAQQDVLNPLGINCIRAFEGRGIRIWGARTISSDPEWKYLNIRRYFAYLERSIELATQWAVFEPNGETLWSNVRRAVDNFLYNEWVSDRLAGGEPESAYFVRCDRSTMTQNDLDNGRMICLIGVAPLYPAEFVIFRIGQWTADSNQ